MELRGDVTLACSAADRAVDLALLVAPGFALLHYLQQRGMLAADETDADLRLAAQLEQRTSQVRP